ncbi:MAG: hypothetical protein VYC44_11595, partial [Chloroflexota bacterium]|nr:hypothetical protein [Chloroflexota bacterium]
RAHGQRSLQDFIYGVRNHLNQYNALTVVTSSVETQWVASLTDLRRQGVEVAVVLVDRSSFGSLTDMRFPLEALSENLIPVYMVRQGDILNDALQTPVKEIPSNWAANIAKSSE